MIAKGTPPIIAPRYIAMLNIGPGIQETKAKASENYYWLTYYSSSI